MRDHRGRTGARDRRGRACRRHPAGAVGAEVALSVMDEVHGGPLAPVLLGAVADGAADGSALVADNRLGLPCQGFRGNPATSLRRRTAWPLVSTAARFQCRPSLSQPSAAKIEYSTRLFFGRSKGRFTGTRSSPGREQRTTRSAPIAGRRRARSRPSTPQPSGR